MKKLFIMVAFVAGTIVSTASNFTNEIAYNEDFGSCTVTVTITNGDGEVVDTIVYQSYQSSELNCRIYAANIGLLYNAQ